ncbi:MAG: PEP-CTERM sorting domain-containing protein, partial [Verrucomicrobiales bacterium]|nr:PEP-CTERM sorting domain-containing protein [Verrucomicrobiales bacterium]
QINTTQVKAASLAGTGTVTFNGSNKKLGLGSVSATDALNAITVHSGAFIAPGDPSGALQAGTLNLGAGIASVKFLAGSIFEVDIASDSLSDQLAIFNTSSPVLDFAAGSIIRLNFLDDYTPDADTDWLLTAGFASLTGDLSKVLLQDHTGGALIDDIWSLSAINGNLLLSYTIPEPSTWALLAGGVGLLALLRRKRRYY